MKEFDLLLDSSGPTLSIGLSKEGKLIDKISYLANQRQSEFMVEELSNLLKKNDLERGDLKAVVSSMGPGSYTGVRISITIAKVIALALDIPLYLVSSLEMLKDKEKPSICIANARGKRSYVGVYQGEEILMNDCILDNGTLLKYIEEHPTYLIKGDGKYLNLDSVDDDGLETMATCIDSKHLCPNSLAASPVYLKDSDPSTKLKTIIRKMNGADMIQVLEIEKECFLDPYTEENISFELRENPFADILVAMVGPTIVGYIDFMHTFDSATINRIAVRKEYRKKGIGKQLLSKCIEEIRSGEEKADFLTLEVRTNNEEAISFYKNNEFEEINIKKNYYSDGQDALYMVRSVING